MARRLHAYSSRPTHQPRVRSRYTRARMTLGGVLVLLVMGYVGITNDVATQGYRLQDLQQQRNNMLQENQRLQLAIAESQSLARIAKMDTQSDLEPVTTIEYLATTPTSVAVR